VTSADTSPNLEGTYRLNVPVLRFALRILGWSQAEFAERAGIHAPTASRILNGSPTTWRVARQIRAAIPALGIDEIVDLGEISPGLPPGVHDKEVPTC